jgi:F-type H+-transporting ATPase subunit delta
MRVTSKQLAQVLYEITDKKSKNEVQNSVADFARYMHKERKLKLAEKIIEQFGKIYNHKNGIVEAEAVSRKMLNESEMRKVKHFVKERYGAKEVVLKNIVDEKIKGGIIIKVGDEVMDGSVSGRITELRKILLN